MTNPIGEAVETVGKTMVKVGEALGLDLDPSAGTVFVTGGTGVVGYRIATRLLRAGYPTVRLGVHHPDKVEELNKLGAEIADFDWDREDTYAKSLAGVKSVFCSAPYTKGWEQKFPAFVRACKDAGVKHFVKLSFYHARNKGDVFQSVPLVRWHGKCDEYLMSSGLSYTILGASHLMSNPLVYQSNTLQHAKDTPATYYGASADKGVNYISPNDVAEVAVRTLLEPHAHKNKEYTLTGPTAIKDSEVADLLSKHLNKSVMYVDQPLHTFEQGEKMGGDPSWMVKDLVALETIKRDGREEDVSFVTNDVELICGHPAETYEDYLRTQDYMTAQEVGVSAA